MKAVGILLDKKKHWFRDKERMVKFREQLSMNDVQR